MIYNEIQNIIFDFDGVILDAVPIKTRAFATLFGAFPADKVDQFLAYHDLHGGVSRYEKIRYFFTSIMHESVEENKIQEYASTFSAITMRELMDSSNLIDSTSSFIRQYHERYNMHIASGADEKDLKEICEALELSPFFRSIHGSPTPKAELVRHIIKQNGYLKTATILIGDSLTDFEAATLSDIRFYGFNNEKLRAVAHEYLDDYRPLA